MGGLVPFSYCRLLGVLSLRQSLDYEQQRVHFLIIEAVDGGDPPLSSTTTVNITVLDANDNAPVFSQPLYETTVPEDAAPGSRIIQVYT